MGYLKWPKTIKLNERLHGVIFFMWCVYFPRPKKRGIFLLKDKMTQRMNWLSLDFGIYPTDSQWSDVGGIYIFTKLNDENRWVPLYIGQASSFKERFSSHERLEEAKKLGVTHIHAKTVPKQADRDLIESRLIESYQPRFNSHYK